MIFKYFQALQGPVRTLYVKDKSFNEQFTDT